MANLDMCVYLEDLEVKRQLNRGEYLRFPKLLCNIATACRAL